MRCVIFVIFVINAVSPELFRSYDITLFIIKCNILQNFVINYRFYGFFKKTGEKVRLLVRIAGEKPVFIMPTKYRFWNKIQKKLNKIKLIIDRNP